MSREPLPRLFVKEMWRRHHAHLITVITGIGFWLADHATLAGVSRWGLGVITVLVLYLFYILYDAWLSTSALKGVVEVPYSMVTDKPIEEAEILFGNHAQVLVDQGIALPRIFDRFLIAGSDWHYFNQNRLASDKWAELIRDLRAHFIRLSKRVTSPARYHLFFVTPPGIALGLGAVLGRDIRAKAYQYFGPERFVPVFDPEAANPRESYHGLQGASVSYTEIERTDVGEASAPDVAILLQFVSHPLSQPVTTDGTQFLRTLAIKHVKYQGHLPASLNWTLLAAEIASCVLREVSAGKRVHLFVGLPAALGFAVGHFLGDHNAILIYHYDKKSTSYHCAFSLNQLG